MLNTFEPVAPKAAKIPIDGECPPFLLGAVELNYTQWASFRP